MHIGDFLEKWGRTLFEAPLAAKSDEPAELAEIRLAVLDRVKEKSYRSGARKVFPYDLLRVELRGLERGDQGVYAGRFFQQYLETEVGNALRAAGCRYPENLRVEVSAQAGIPAPGDEWLVVTAATQQEVRACRPAARLLVKQGTANMPEARLEKPRVNIGRVVDVYRAEGLSRRNDLAFEAETEINLTVSREHAHIDHDAARGEYRLFNDRWYERGAECGTWIVRDGVIQEVHRTPRGLKLQPGDEIHFGRAVVVFEA